MIYGFDIETNMLNAFAEEAKILTAVLWNEKEFFLWENGAHDDDRFAFKKILEDEQNIIVGHNLIAFDVPWWEAHVGPIESRFFDTMVANSLLDETGEGNSLEVLAKRYTDEEVDQEMKGQRSKLEDLPIKDVLAYNISDSRISHKLYEPLLGRLEEEGLDKLFFHIMQVGRVLADMMGRGINLDGTFIGSHIEMLDQEVERLRGELLDAVRGEVEEEFNFNSSQQLGELLYTKLEMPVYAYTKTGKPTADEATINMLASKSHNKAVSEWLKKILLYKKRRSMRTKLFKLSSQHVGLDGRVHTNYHLGKSMTLRYKGGTVTGRLSSSKPNLQNVPRDGKVKGAFIPTPGKLLAEADHAQLEVRVAAWYSQEARLLSAFEEGKDIHTASLARIKGVEYETAVENVESGAWKDARWLVKRIVFGTLYGAGARTIQEQARHMGMEIGIHQAQDTINKFFGAYPDLRRWITETEHYIMAHKEIETPMGRKRRLPFASKLDARGYAQLRQGVNFMVQSLASDITLVGLLILGRRFKYDGGCTGSDLLLTVHDSILMEHDPEDYNLEHIVRGGMTTDTNYFLKEQFNIQPLPLKVDITTHKERWGETE